MCGIESREDWKECGVGFADSQTATPLHRGWIEKKNVKKVDSK